MFRNESINQNEYRPAIELDRSQSKQIITHEHWYASIWSTKMSV